MYISKLRLMNWRNFKAVNVPLGERMFFVGPNASGKSNLLDVFRFLKDITRPDGGLQKAVMMRGGLAKIRNLSARKNLQVEIEVELTDSKNHTKWIYELHVNSKKNGTERAEISKERVIKNEQVILNRPDAKDEEDSLRLSQTSLEQVMANKDFREISEHFSSIEYFHLVPQLIRYSPAFAGPGIDEDPFGQHFIERIAKVGEKTRQNRLKKIEAVLRIVVPQLKYLKEKKDEMGIPHLEVSSSHWRLPDEIQKEDQFSDGMLRLIGLLWGLMGTGTLLLLEEPELSLHEAILDKLPSLMHRLKKKQGQVFVSTHSQTLLSDRGIGGEEILMLIPGNEETSVQVAAALTDVRILLESGMIPADVVIPKTTPENIQQLGLIK
ncbi:MAG TPA: AAA family ATPase [Candidatus Kapabacteria bacterium]|nr:AAA family ATPase [Candidatus Kapabacteria bacterium]